MLTFKMKPLESHLYSAPKCLLNKLEALPHGFPGEQAPEPMLRLPDERGLQARQTLS